MSLELIRKHLDGVSKDNQELSFEHVTKAIEEIKRSEEERFKQEARKIREDINKLKPFKKALEDVGYNGDSELSEFIESLKTAKKEIEDKPIKSELEKQISALGKQIEALNKENAAAKEREAGLQKERKVSYIKEKLMKDIGEKLAGGEAYVKSLIYEGVVDVEEDGKTIIFVDGDLRKSYDEGVRAFIKGHESDLKDVQRIGANSSPGNGKPVITSDMPLSEMMKLR